MIIIPARKYFSVGEICFVGGPTRTDGFRLNTAPKLLPTVKRDAIGLIMVYFIIFFQL